MRFIYYFILGINFIVLSANSNNNQPYIGINKCEINNKDHKDFKYEKLNNKSYKISITSKVKIRNKRVNLAISEAKLKAKKKLIKFLNRQNSNNQRISRSSNNSLSYYLKGAIVTRICIKDGQFLKLYLVLNSKNINTNNKYNHFINKE